MEICGTQLSCPAGKLQRLPLHGNQQEGFCVQSREKIPPSAPVTDNAKFIPNSPQWQRAVTGAREHRGVAAYWRGDSQSCTHLGPLPREEAVHWGEISESLVGELAQGSCHYLLAYEVFMLPRPPGVPEPAAHDLPLANRVCLLSLAWPRLLLILPPLHAQHLKISFLMLAAVRSLPPTFFSPSGGEHPWCHTPCYLFWLWKGISPLRALFPA